MTNDTPFTTDIIKSLTAAGATRTESMGRAHRAGTSEYLYSMRVRDLDLDTVRTIVRGGIDEGQVYGYTGVNGSVVVSVRIDLS